MNDRLPDVNPDYAVTFRLKQGQMSRAITPSGHSACTAWWLEQMELSMDRLSNHHYVDAAGSLCIEFWLGSQKELDAAVAAVSQFGV